MDIIKALKIALCSAALLGCSMVSYGQNQTIDNLKDKRKAAEAEIARIDAELAKLKSSSTDLQSQLRLSSQRLSKRREVLSSIDKQIGELNSKEKHQSAAAVAYGERLDMLRSSYRSSVKELYRLKQTTTSAELLLGDSLARNFTHRDHMVRVLLDSIKSQSLSIELTQGELGAELREIALRKEELVVLKADEAEEIAAIASEQKEIRALEAKLGKQTKDLSSQKSRQQKALEELQRQISLAIEAEIRAKGGNSSTLDKEILAAYSDSFQGAKGNLRPPISGAKIIDRYGVHNHPTQAGIKIDNRGVNLQGSANQEVVVIAGGEVRKIFVVPGMGTSVLVRHGEYLTVYSNLKTISVKSGDRVVAGEAIGKLADDGILHFEIWKETKSVNPADWVKF